MVASCCQFLDWIRQAISMQCYTHMHLLFHIKSRSHQKEMWKNNFLNNFSNFALVKVKVNGYQFIFSTYLILVNIQQPSFSHKITIFNIPPTHMSYLNFRINSTTLCTVGAASSLNHYGLDFLKLSKTYEAIFIV